MGSKTFDGVWFISFSHDHLPPHVHGQYGEVTVVVELLPNGGVRPAKRKDAVTPANSKRGDIRRILRVASEHRSELLKLWEHTHGPAS